MVDYSATSRRMNVWSWRIMEHQKSYSTVLTEDTTPERRSPNKGWYIYSKIVWEIVLSVRLLQTQTSFLFQITGVGSQLHSFMNDAYKNENENNERTEFRL
jgi:hypothetical protein